MQLGIERLEPVVAPFRIILPNMVVVGPTRAGRYKQRPASIIFLLNSFVPAVDILSYYQCNVEKHMRPRATRFDRVVPPRTASVSSLADLGYS